MEQREHDDRDLRDDRELRDEGGLGDERDDEAAARRDEAPETSDEATDAGAGTPSTASLLHGDGDDRDDDGDRDEREERESRGLEAREGADEQLTVPEDREAAAAADRRTGAPHSPNGDERPFELFEGSDLDGYRQRWDALQASFVDDPRAAAEQADALVGELVERVTRRHQQLHDEVGGGADEGDTETMRQALRRYRAFYQTLVGGRT